MRDRREKERERAYMTDIFEGDDDMYVGSNEKKGRDRRMIRE